jgi:hypothetical protein
MVLVLWLTGRLADKRVVLETTRPFSGVLRIDSALSMRFDR